MKYSLLALLVLISSAALAQTTPCDYLPESRAAAILGVPIEKRSSSQWDCSYNQKGFTGGTTGNNKIVELSIWRSATPKPDDVKKAKDSIAYLQRTAPLIVKPISDFGDVA